MNNQNDFELVIRRDIDAMAFDPVLWNALAQWVEAAYQAILLFLEKIRALYAAYKESRRLPVDAQVDPTKAGDAEPVDDNH